MKTLILIAFLCIFCHCAYCQEKFIKTPKDIVRKAMSSDKKVLFISSGKSDDKSMDFDVYVISEGHSITFFYGVKSNCCLLIVEDFENKDMVFPAISDLNKRFNKINDNTWLSKDNTTKVVLAIQEKLFEIEYQII